MVGLVAYDSSDEDAEVQDVPESHPATSDEKSSRITVATNGSSQSADPEGRPRLTARSRAFSAEQNAKPSQSSLVPSELPSVSDGPSMIYSAPIGPIFGPTGPPPDGDSAALPDPDSFPDDDFSGAPGAGGPAAAAGAAEGPASGGIRPNSPYTRERALIRDLTLPAVPTLDLPPSPAGRDPAPGLNARLERFLALKREGEHFNARLSRSSAMMNPALMDKLMAFVGLEDAAQQYVTTVGTDIFDPVNGFPEWNGREKLKEAVRILNQEIEDEKAMRGPRDAIEFVPASSSSASQRPR